MPFVFSGQDGGVWTMRSNKKCAAWESMARTAVVLGRSGTACRAPTENKERVRDRASVARIVMCCCVGTGLRFSSTLVLQGRQECLCY